MKYIFLLFLFCSCANSNKISCPTFKAKNVNSKYVSRVAYHKARPVKAVIKSTSPTEQKLSWTGSGTLISHSSSGTSWTTSGSALTFSISSEPLPFKVISLDSLLNKK